jgi:hypothetical protein
MLPLLDEPAGTSDGTNLTQERAPSSHLRPDTVRAG